MISIYPGYSSIQKFYVKSSFTLLDPGASSMDSNHHKSNIGSHKWPKTRQNQIFNILYFGTFAFLFCGMGFSHHCGLHLLTGVASLAVFAISGIYLFKYRSCISIKEELPNWAGRALRSLALLLPIAVFATGYIPAPSEFASSEPISVSLESLNAPSSDTIHATALAPPMVTTYNDEPFENEPVHNMFPTGDFNLSKELKLADAFYVQQNYKDAAKHYHNALNADPQNEHANEYLADIHYHVRPQSGLVQEYTEKVLEVNPNNVHAAWLKRALTLNK